MAPHWNLRCAAVGTNASADQFVAPMQADMRGTCLSLAGSGTERPPRDYLAVDLTIPSALARRPRRQPGFFCTNFCYLRRSIHIEPHGRVQSRCSAPDLVFPS